MLNNLETGIPVVPMRGLVILPGEVVNFEVGRDGSKAAVLAAMKGDGVLCLACQRDPAQQEVEFDDVFHVGTLCRIRNMIRKPDGSLRLVAEGFSRCGLSELLFDTPYMCVRALRLESLANHDAREAALRAKVFECLAEYARISGKLKKEAVSAIETLVDSGEFADVVANAAVTASDDRQELLEAVSVSARLELLYGFMLSILEIRRIDIKIEQEVKSRIEKNQKEYYLREKLKTIRTELGDGEESEAEKYREQMNGKRFPDEFMARLEKEIDRLSDLPAGSHEGPVARTYIECLLELPYFEKTKDSIDLARARRILDRDHYGLDKVKDRIIEHLAVSRLTGKLTGQVLCFIGPPGVGKTSISESVAAALGRKFVRMSLGGIHDEAEIRGHRRTYIGAMPGRIISAMRQAGTANPVILFDEIDKLGRDYKGDPASAMLEVLDTAQNHAFRDHFIELPYDLSDVMFITTANNYEGIPPMLLDRMEVIDVSGYLRTEKLSICRKHLIPKQLKKHGLTASKLRIPADCIYELIDSYTREAGVRGLERAVAAVCRKAAVSVAENGKSVRLTKLLLEEYLGRPKYRRSSVELTPHVGLVNGLAWTAMGGEVLDVEAQAVPGDGKIQITGHVGQVMEESAKAAVTFVKAHHALLGVEPSFFKENDIHIHVPEGATPKDGPSAGITIAVAVSSMASGVPVKAGIAMTGEITLRGRVLPIGGLREKLMAAVRAGITSVIIPSDNMRDVDEVPDEVKAELTLIPVDTAREALNEALESLPCVVNGGLIGQEGGVGYGRICN